MSVPAVAPGRSVGHRIVSQVVRSPLGLRFGRNIASRVDPTLIRLTRGHVSSVWPFPAVVITHVGTTSGRTRRSALVYFTDQGRRVIHIATNFGRSRHPAWYHNVEANPVVTLYGRGIRGRFIAKEIYDAERDRLFQRAKDAPSPNGQYERAAATQSRCVPVIAFTPQSRRCDPAVVDPAHSDKCGFDDVIDPHGTGLAQYPPTRDHDPVNPNATVVAIAERAAKPILAAR